MVTISSLFVPRRFLGPHHFKSIAIIDSKKESYTAGISIVTRYSTTYNMNSVADHTLYTSAAEIFKTPWFYAGVAIITLLIAFFVAAIVFFCFLMVKAARCPDCPDPFSSDVPGLLLAIHAGLICGLIIELFGVHGGVFIALSSMMEALVKRVRGAYTRWHIEDAVKWDAFRASLKRF
jgi:hypothetical protein